MDIYKLLKDDHKKVKTMFIEALDTDEEDVEERENLFDRINHDLLSHTKAEERVLYSKMTEYPDSREQIEDSLQEHALVENLLHEIRSLGVESDEWVQKMKTLQKNVDHHVKEEEGVLFPKAKKHFSEKEADRMGIDFERLKSDILTSKVA